jgi:hypothetical protein
MANNRIFYACQMVAIGNKDGNSLTKVHGVQSVGINTTFNLEQVYEIGMVSIYSNIEGIADIDVTIEKVLDGHDLLYKLATAENATNNLVSKSASRCSVALRITDDTLDSSKGTTRTACIMKNMVVNQISYKASVDGSVTESIGLIGNEKIWTNTWVAGDFLTDPAVPDEPAYTGGVARRQHVNVAGSTLPSIIANTDSIQSLSVSASITREKILELGRKAPYFRYAKFPVEISSEFEIIAKTGDGMTISETENNLTNETIILVFTEGTTINLGTKNKMQSINYQGGGTDGNNATTTYSFKTFNDFIVTHT